MQKNHIVILIMMKVRRHEIEARVPSVMIAGASKEVIRCRPHDKIQCVRYQFVY